MAAQGNQAHNRSTSHQGSTKELPDRQAMKGFVKEVTFDLRPAVWVGIYQVDKRGEVIWL